MFKIRFLFILPVVFLLLLTVYSTQIIKPAVQTDLTRQEKPSHIPSKNNLPVFKVSQLSQYDGTNPKKPIYIGLNGKVYDVSAGADKFYAPGKVYHFLVGKDSSTQLNVFGPHLISDKYPVVGILEKD